MKTRILICFFLCGILSAVKSKGAINIVKKSHTVVSRLSSKSSAAVTKCRHFNHIFSRANNSGTHAALNSRLLNNNSLLTARAAALDSVTKLLRLKLYLDPYDYDDIVIGLNSGAKTAYDFNEDSKYLPGIDAAVGLASYSSDGVPLSINLIPLPGQQQEVIKLDVEAQSSGQVTLKRTELDQIPTMYDIWLRDNYKKDSVDLRVDTNYVFTINKADSATFGSNRFCVIIRRVEAKPLQLVDFNAAKAGTNVKITWQTQNEENYTVFDVERSIDDGTTFETLDSLKSSSTGSYSYTDNNPPLASDEYRLKITDANGAISFSNTVTLINGTTASAAAGNLSIYPNPTNGMINLTINQSGTDTSSGTLATQDTGAYPSLAASTSTAQPLYNIKIVSIGGSVIKSATSSAATWQSNITGLLPGTYIITVVNNSDSKLVGRTTFVKL